MRKFFAIIALFSVTILASGQTVPKLPVDPQVRYGKLDNGLTYYIRQNPYPENRADFYIAQRVGSMQEEDNQSGLAHFLEHMAFNGTKHYPGRKTMLDYLEKNGVKFGANVNAYTGFDETVYNLSNVPVVRQGVVDSCLLILHDWSGYITLDNDEIDKERLIIKEEWRTRGNAQMRIWEKQFPQLFKGSKYANRMPIGSMDVVENFKYQTLKDYYHKWYRPDLQAIIVVGDIDVEAVELQIRNMFSDIPMPTNPAERVYYPVEDNDEPLVAISTDPEQTSTRVTLYIKHDAIPNEIKSTEQGMMLSIVKSLISQMMGDRLSEIAQKADAPFGAAGAYDGNYIVSKSKDAWTSIGISKDGKINETLAALVRENERVKRFGFTDAELERAKATMLKNYENAYNNRNKEKNDRYTDEYVRSFTDFEPIPGIEFEYNLAKQVAAMLNADIVNRIAGELITEKNSVISVVGPEKSEIVYPTDTELVAVYKNVVAEDIKPYEEKLSNEPLITQLPAKGSVVKTESDAKLGTTLWTLSNGMRVAVKKTDFKDDEIVMRSIAYGGKSIVPDADVHNAEFASAVPYIGGIGNFSSTDLKKVLAGKTAQVNVNLSTWNQSVSGSSSVKDLETLLQLTYLYFTAPRKDQESYSSLLDMVKNQLKNQDSDPSFVFKDSIVDGMYNGNIRTRSMKLSDAEKLNYDRIISIYKELLANPGSFVFTFVGNVDEATLKPLVEQYLASLPAGNRKATYGKANYDTRKGEYKNTFDQEMKTPKTSVFELYSGLATNDQKTNMTLSALKQILDIVYVRTVREEEGGTYGVGTNAQLLRIPAGQILLRMSFDTDPEKAAKLTPIIDRELRKIADLGPDDDDFLKVKEYMAKKYQEDVKTNQYWNSILNTYYFYSEDDYSNYTSVLNALTQEDIKAFTQKLLSQGNFVEVIMNPKK